jgi:hypothetical protein
MLGLFAVIAKETSSSQKWVRWLRYQVVYILTIINGSTVLSAYPFHSACEVIPGQRLARRWLLPSLRMLLFPREAAEISCSQQTVLCKCAAAATVEWSHLLLLSQRISFCKACALLNMSMTSFFHDIRVPSRVTNRSEGRPLLLQQRKRCAHKSTLIKPPQSPNPTSGTLGASSAHPRRKQAKVYSSPLRSAEFVGATFESRLWSWQAGGWLSVKIQPRSPLMGALGSPRVSGNPRRSNKFSTHTTFLGFAFICTWMKLSSTAARRFDFWSSWRIGCKRSIGGPCGQDPPRFTSL